MNSVFFILYLLSNPKLIIPLIKRIYLPIYIQFKWLQKYEIETIIDIGTHNGNVAQSLNFLFPNALIYAFEPVIENHKIIKNKIPKDKLILTNLAVSNKTTKSPFYKYTNTALSSLRPMENLFKKTYKVNPSSKKIIINTTTLDSYFKNKKIKNAILKIDTQGNENQILQGSTKTLKKVSVIIVEVSFAKFYKDQDLFNKIYKTLTTQKFKYLGEARESEFYPTFGTREQINAVFVKNSLLP